MARKNRGLACPRSLRFERGATRAQEDFPALILLAASLESTGRYCTSHKCSAVEDLAVEDTYVHTKNIRCIPAESRVTLYSNAPHFIFMFSFSATQWGRWAECVTHGIYLPLVIFEPLQGLVLDRVSLRHLCCYNHQPVSHGVSHTAPHHWRV